MVFGRKVAHYMFASKEGKKVKWSYPITHGKEYGNVCYIFFTMRVLQWGMDREVHFWNNVGSLVWGYPVVLEHCQVNEDCGT